MCDSVASATGQQSVNEQEPTTLLPGAEGRPLTANRDAESGRGLPFAPGREVAVRNVDIGASALRQRQALSARTGSGRVQAVASATTRDSSVAVASATDTRRRAGTSHSTCFSDEGMAPRGTRVTPANNCALALWQAARR